MFQTVREKEELFPHGDVFRWSEYESKLFYPFFPSNPLSQARLKMIEGRLNNLL